MQPTVTVPPAGSPERSPSAGGSAGPRALLIAVAVGALTAVSVFAILYAAFGRPAETVAVGGPTSSINGTGTTAPALGSVQPARTTPSAIDSAGGIESIPIKLSLGDQLRVKVVPTVDDFDPIVGLAMRQSDLVNDYWSEGFNGLPSQLLKQQYRLLYSDTEAPSTIAPILAAHNNGEGEAEWLTFVAPADAEYTLIVRGNGDSAGGYVLTSQVRTADREVRNVDRLVANDAWIDRDSVITRAKESGEFLLDETFYSEPQFTAGGRYLGPDAEAVVDLLSAN